MALKSRNTVLVRGIPSSLQNYIRAILTQRSFFTDQGSNHLDFFEVSRSLQWENAWRTRNRTKLYSADDLERTLTIRNTDGLKGPHSQGSYLLAYI